MACIDKHAMACIYPSTMNGNLLNEIDAFQSLTGKSDYRIGIEAVKNGRLVERLRSGGRVWPETEAAVRDYLEKEKGVSA